MQLITLVHIDQGNKYKPVSAQMFIRIVGVAAGTYQKG